MKRFYFFLQRFIKIYINFNKNMENRIFIYYFYNNILAMAASAEYKKRKDKKMQSDSLFKYNLRCYLKLKV